MMPSSGFFVYHLPAKLYSDDMRTVSVQLGRSQLRDTKSRPGLLKQLGAECARLKLGARCAIITDTNVGKKFAKLGFESLVKAGFEPMLIIVPAGETAKSLKSVQTCYDQLAAHRLERKSFIVALGGGVVGDLAGFVAATYLRGIAFVQVPTTLLAQVDSSVGGKTGVNLRAGKNLVGAFYQPRLVLCDLDALKTLPEREFRSGLAEVIKYGIIYDAALFAQLERDLPKLLRREPTPSRPSSRAAAKSRPKSSARTKRKAACAPFLNFGHTIGHAIENSSGYGKYLHGEAIAIGQVGGGQIVAENSRPAVAATRHGLKICWSSAGLPVKMQLNARPARKTFCRHEARQKGQRWRNQVRAGPKNWPG